MYLPVAGYRRRRRSVEEASGEEHTEGREGEAGLQGGEVLIGSAAIILSNSRRFFLLLQFNKNLIQEDKLSEAEQRAKDEQVRVDAVVGDRDE